MPPAVSRKALLDVAGAKKSQLGQWRHGIWITQATGLTLDDLALRVTADRWRLGQDFHRRAVKMLGADPPQYRDAISRFYYAMYHVMRAVVYLSHGGDDHEAHNKLPAETPSDFVDSDNWSNRLKNAREVRNRADYEAYPKSSASWRPDAQELQLQSSELLSLTRAYLRARGCVI